MMVPPIHHTHPHRQPKVDIAVYHALAAVQKTVGVNPFVTNAAPCTIVAKGGFRTFAAVASQRCREVQSRHPDDLKTGFRSAAPQVG